MSSILHHLIKASQAEVLLKEFAALSPGSGLALLYPDGALFAAADRADAAASDLKVVQGQVQPPVELDLRIIPIYAGGETVALIAARPCADALLPALQRSITMVLQGNLEKREIIRETLDRYREINLLYHTAETIGTCLDANEIPSLVLKESARVIPSEAGLVLLRDQEGEGDLTIHAAHPAPNEPTSEDLSPLVAGLYASANELIDLVIQSGRSAIRGGVYPFDALLCAPLKGRERVFGAVVLGRFINPTLSATKDALRDEERNQFTAGEEKLLTALTNQAGIAIEKAWMHRQELQRQRLEQELIIGRRIQRSLLPETLPSLAGWEFAAYYQAARVVGGDFYDFFQFTVEHRAANLPKQPSAPDCEAQNSLGVFIADVTGKGVPAALMMASSRAMLRSLLHTEMQCADKPAEVLHRLNDLLLQDNRTGLLLTALYAALDPDSGRLSYANAGHERPVWLRAGPRDCLELVSRGALLGAFGALDLEEASITLAPGDQFILYTDGATEARSPQGALFGEERLQETLMHCLDYSAEATAQAVLRAVQDFSSNAPLADDLTVVVIKRSGG